MNVVVWQLGHMQNWHAATKVFRAFRSAGVEPNAYVCTSLIAALGSVGLILSLLYGLGFKNVRISLTVLSRSLLFDSFGQD